MSNDYSLVAFRPENKDIYPRREYDVIPDLPEFRNAYKWIARYKPSIFSNITSEALEDLYSAVINKKKGKSSCSSCSGCAMRGSCPSQK